MRVKAKELLFYGMRRVKAGEVFSLKSKEDFNEKKMDAVDKSDVPAKSGKPAKGKSGKGKDAPPVESSDEQHDDKDVI